MLHDDVIIQTTIETTMVFYDVQNFPQGFPRKHSNALCIRKSFPILQWFWCSSESIQSIYVHYK